MELKEFKIAFAGLKQGKHEFSFELDNEFFETLGLKVYPNPFLEKLSFHPRAEAIGKSISIYSLVGKIVWNYKVVSDEVAEVNTLNWPQGFYILNVDGKTLKLLKQ